MEHFIFEMASGKKEGARGRLISPRYFSSEIFKDFVSVLKYAGRIVAQHPDFAAVLQKHLGDECTLTDWAPKLGTTQSHLSNVIGRRRSVSMEDAKAWAEKLELTGKALDRFMKLAAITHIPRDARPVFVELIYELESLRSLARRLDP